MINLPPRWNVAKINFNYLSVVYHKNFFHFYGDLVFYDCFLSITTFLLMANLTNPTQRIIIKTSNNYRTYSFTY
jgi:hypothetical protein